jgi:hypothetical protein
MSDQIRDVINTMRLLWQRGNDTYEIACLLRMPEATVYNYMIEAGILKGQTNDQVVVAFATERKPFVEDCKGPRLQK